METYSQKYFNLGYTAMKIRLTWDEEAQQKKIMFKKLWQHATPENWRSYFDQRDNGVAIITGEASDLIVVDCDLQKPKDVESNVHCGMLAFTSWIQEKGLPENTPIQESASGGRHYFFSLSKSLQKGLLNAKSMTKLSVQNETYSIDTRADKGCIIVAPSAVIKDSRTISYKWIQPLVERSMLPSMPEWCIQHLNANVSTKTMPIEQAMQTLTLSSRSQSFVEQDSNTALFVARVRLPIEGELGCKMAHPLRPRGAGVDFLCKPVVVCSLCGLKHTRNHYLARPILDHCFYMRNYAKKCISRAYNWEDHHIIKRLIAYPATDLPYCRILHATFRDRGYTLVYAYKQGATTGRFLCFDGIVWQELPRNVVAREVEAVCGVVLDNLISYIKPGFGCTDKDEIDKINKKKTQLKRGRTYISRNSNTNSIVDMYRTQYGDNEIESKLDTNPDLLAVHNGIINLQTGECRSGLPEDYMVTKLDTDYNGLKSSTKDIDEFMLDIFDNNTELIEYVKKLLGYAITGHTSEQCWLILTGSGGNGKSLLVGLLEKLLEKWYVTAPYEIFFKNSKRTQAGGASPHLGTMNGARICKAPSRALYAKDYETYQPTALPILICNHKPTIDVDDAAMLRRIKVIPFTNIYTSPEDPSRPYNPHNPRHRQRDPNVRKKLLTKYSQEQLLVWLVQGAVKWYAEGLGKLPKCMEDAFSAYCLENDKLGEFIEDYCEQSPEYKVNAGEFRDAFKLSLGSGIQQKILIEMMKKRGFQHTVAKDEISSSSVKVYKGLKLVILGTKRY
ncbi:hypothetical protein BGZ46_007992 [Entomortierella lignicola]|nr:hypothetical protein BGZ46_007992 [Entomortierella lignicola]